MRGKRWILVAAALAIAASPSMADEGDLVLGQTMPYSGAASALSAVGKVQTRYFEMINAKGGINGRKVKLISLDDAYSPPKAVEQTRRLVESDGAVAIFGSMGTAQNAAVQKYLNSRKIPQLFVFAASDRFADPHASPYTLSGMTLFSTEATVYARLVSSTIPAARVAVLYQNDDYGREYLRSFKAELARLDSKAEIVAASPYEVTSPTVDSLVVALASTNANVFLNASTGKFTTQAIRKAGELGWRAQQFLPIGSNFVATILKPAGLEYSKGAISATPTKTVGDPEWVNDPGYLEWLDFMKKYYPEGNIEEQLNFTGWNIAVLMTKVLEACGSDLSPENIMKQATALKEVKLPGLIPGITVNTSRDDYRLIKSLRPQRFDGTRWVTMSDAIAIK
ncbi:ABC transporter substrate-binding protein [Bradyrhizobium lablabi]|uniref:ABC transporter substrate-binding protein n=1 Tax=Bradyrhizobium lablabi TaxID=722472 RepID=UPI001BACA779|nr:ABC transporter substrate-binding protein [Bradyrhizobium lablabi]MBR1121554.1 ABC transporter substrate-binding protein [Bradyrhizobium lablabi]